MIGIIISSVAGWGFTAAVGATVVDVGVVFPIIGAGVMTFTQKGNTPEEKAAAALSLCNKARWAQHKSEQLLYEAANITKDLQGAVAGVDADLTNIEQETAELKREIARMHRVYKPVLITTIIGTILFVIAFAFITRIRGKHLRAELDSLRKFEANLPEQPSAASAPAS